jgi:hypothetical protein
MIDRLPEASRISRRLTERIVGGNQMGRVLLLDQTNSLAVRPPLLLFVHAAVCACNTHRTMQAFLSRPEHLAVGG